MTAVELTPEQHQALLNFARRTGRNWRAALRRLWELGVDWKQEEGPYLRQIRNLVGPSGLDKLKISHEMTETCQRNEKRALSMAA